MESFNLKILLPILLALFSLNTAWADFSDASTRLHPFSPEGRPYIIDIQGDWPTDCHPGEQKPVIASYTGDTVVIEFETIILHVTCNDVATPYRVLVDMSDVVDSTQVSPMEIDVTMRFGGTEFTKTLPLNCICSPSRSPALKPEGGLYNSVELQKQGLILARQDKRMAVYPLVYDETGSSEWLFGGGGVEEEVYFVELNELSNGQCLGCAPPANPPEMNVVGKLTMLMDSESVIQVKINDGMFEEYKPLLFGYGEYEIWDPSAQVHVKVPALQGRWAFSKANSVDQSVTPPPTSYLPLVFDIKSRDKVNPPPPVITPPPEPPEGHSVVTYAIADMEGKLVATMGCQHLDELICELRVPGTGELIAQFDVQVLSMERMFMSNTATPDQGDTAGSGTVVRVE